tara:strand:+ start:231 stop:401 length:171 start_codon:yes stop_codon:yes gene_type:complete
MEDFLDTALVMLALCEDVASGRIGLENRRHWDVFVEPTREMLKACVKDNKLLLMTS